MTIYGKTLEQFLQDPPIPFLPYFNREVYGVEITTLKPKEE